MTTEYVASKQFIIGDADLTLSRGEVVSYHKTQLTRESSGKVYDISERTLNLMVRAGLLLANSPDVSIVPAREVQAPVKEKFPVKVQNQSDNRRVVGQVETPMTKASSTTESPVDIEDQLKITAESTSMPRKVMTQKKVAVAGAEERRKALTEKEAAKNPVVREMLDRKADAPVQGGRVIKQASSGRVVTKIKSPSDYAKEGPTKPGSKEGAKVAVGNDGFPVGYPHDGHWTHRIKWCQANASRVEALKIVYTMSTESFQGKLSKDFPDINFEG